MKHPLKLGILMDPIETINPKKDSTFAMMLSAQAREHQLYYFQQSDIFVEAGKANVCAQSITVTDNNEEEYYHVGEKHIDTLSQFDAILMRKDPPFDMEYIYTTYQLEMAEREGTVIVNPPQALRAVNEKFSISNFADITPKTLISRDINRIKNFIEAEQKCVIKPMDGMGGAGIFKVQAQDANTNAILESLGNGKHTLMVQAYLDAVTEGDKRILMVDGQVPQHGLARIPQGEDFRANLAAGGKGVVQPLTEREKEICARVKPWIQEMELTFVGLDVIGGHVTEINVTSPTCIREIERETSENIADRLIDAIENKIARH